MRADYKNDYTLWHEQTHFNTTALYARGLAKELNRKKIRSKDSPDIKSTLSKWQTKMESWQKQCDLDTTEAITQILRPHGINGLLTN